MLPTVEFCGLEITRLIIGANPFGGYSHQNRERDQEMVTWSTPERIRETWDRAWAAGLNTFITNNETKHVIETTASYLAEGGPMQWIGQLSHRSYDGDWLPTIDRAAEIGCKAAFLHGGIIDNCFAQRDEATLRAAIRHGQSLGLPMGVAGHAVETHEWVDSLDLVDFHVVCFFNCGSLHNGQGERFHLSDAFRAVELIQRLDKPCIGYKILGAGRIDARMGFEFAFDGIKPGDVVNVGMHRGDKDNIVEENADIVRGLLQAAEPALA